MRKRLGYLMIATVAFSVGVLATVLWSVMPVHFAKPQRVMVADAPPRRPLATPADWQKLVADDKFTFCLPLGMKMEQGVATETYTRAYSSKAMDVIVKYGDSQTREKQENPVSRRRRSSLMA